MEFLYNPDLMSEEDVKSTFVARQGLVDKLKSLIEQQPHGAGVQHVIIIAPRGMGKTTILLMVQFAIWDSDSSKQWQVVRFPEERYNVYDLADFWIEILRHLANDTNDDALNEQIDRLTYEFRTQDDLQEASFALIKDWSNKNKKRIVVLVDNFDQILTQIGNERENARLRDVLMNDGTLMVIGGATTFFQEARDYDQPLYNFFKIYNLNDFSYEQIVELLLRRADRDGREDIEEILKKNESRLHALKYFTGGNPRLVLMLYDVIAKSNLTDVRNALEKLLDEVTPYFKAKIETLAPQQRKIVDYVASVSGQTNEGLSPTEIAKAVRMTPNQVSSQLKRLVESGYVRAANIKGRSSYYALSEPLFSIWHQMRSGRNSRERRRWLVSILRALYDSREVRDEQDKLDSRFLEYVRDGRIREAKDTLEHKLCLVEASDTTRSHGEVESIISCFLELDESDSLRTELTPDVLSNLSQDTLRRLLEAGYINEDQFEKSQTNSSLSDEEKAHAEAAASFMLGRLATSRKEPDDTSALSHFTKCTELDSSHHNGWVCRGISLWRLGRLEDAIPIFETAIAAYDKCYISWLAKGDILRDLGRKEEAVEIYTRVVEIDPNKHEGWCHRNRTLFDLKRFDEVVEGTKKLVEINPNDDCAWASQGAALSNLKRYDNAIPCYETAIRLEPKRADYITGYANVLLHLGRQGDAIENLDKAIDIDKEDESIWFLRGKAYALQIERLIKDGSISQAEITLVEAIKSFQRAKADNWLEIISSILFSPLTKKRFNVVRRLIKSSSLEDEMFPLLRAMEFMEKEEASLIEKLSPEVKGLVEAIVAQIKMPKTRSETTKKRRPSKNVK